MLEELATLPTKIVVEIAGGNTGLIQLLEVSQIYDPNSKQIIPDRGKSALQCHFANAVESLHLNRQWQNPKGDKMAIATSQNKYE